MDKQKLIELYDDFLPNAYIIPILLLLASMALLGFNYATTGDVIERDITLSGGVSVTVLAQDADVDQLEQTLLEEFPSLSIQARELTEFGRQTGVIVEANVEQGDDELEPFLQLIADQVNVSRDDLSVDTIAASLGTSFFIQTMKALWVAFVFMGAAVFLYFGDSTRKKIYLTTAALVTSIMVFSLSSFLLLLPLTLTIVLLAAYTYYSIPSMAVILAGFSTVVVTLAIMSVLGIELGTASIAALLMLIGYSIDTDILLSTRVIKERYGTLKQRIRDAMSTGVVMTFSTLGAVSITYFFAQSTTLRQIMLVLIIGLIVDLVNTWLQNTSILYHYETTWRKKWRS